MNGWDWGNAGVAVPMEMERRRRRSSGRGRKSIGPAARACKGRSAGAFRACVRRVMRGGRP